MLVDLVGMNHIQHPAREPPRFSPGLLHHLPGEFAKRVSVIGRSLSIELHRLSEIRIVRRYQQTVCRLNDEDRITFLEMHPVEHVLRQGRTEGIAYLSDRGLLLHVATWKSEWLLLHP